MTRTILLISSTYFLGLFNSLLIIECKHGDNMQTLQPIMRILSLTTAPNANELRVSLGVSSEIVKDLCLGKNQNAQAEQKT